MSLIQFAVFLMLLFEIREVFTYHKLRQFEDKHKQLEKEYGSDLSKNPKYKKLMADNASSIIYGFTYLLIIFILLFTSVWKLSVIMIGLVIIGKVLKKFNTPHIVRFLIDKVVSLIAIGYILLQLFN